MRIPAHKRIAVASVHDHPELAKLVAARQENADKTQEEAERITREMGRTLKQEERSREKFWVDVAHMLKGKLPADFSMDTYILEFSHGTIYTFKKEDVEQTDLEAFLNKIFEPKGHPGAAMGKMPTDAVIH